MDAAEVADLLGLVPLPVEGGWFHQFWRSPADAPRPVGTAIIAMLTDEADGFSQFHRLTADEVWHYSLGDPLELVLLEPGGSSRRVHLGPDIAGGDQLVWVVPAGTWMAAQTTGGWSVFGTAMAPGFTSECYEGADADELLAGWPGERESIGALTRPGSGRSMPPGL